MESASQEERSGRVTVLIVEDEHLSRKALVTLLAANGYLPEAARSAEEALQMLLAGRAPQYAVVDLDLPGMNGAELIRRLRAHNPRIVPVLVTAASMERVEKLVRDEQPLPYLRKPIAFEDLLEIISANHNVH